MRLSGFFIIWHSYRIYLYEWNPPEIRYLIIFVKLIVIYSANQGLFMREKGFSFKDCLFSVSARRGGRQEGGRGPHEGGAPGAGEIEVTWGLFVQIIKWKYFFLHRQEAIKQAAPIPEDVFVDKACLAFFTGSKEIQSQQHIIGGQKSMEKVTV